MEVSEQCDGTYLSSKKCAALGFAGGGILKCNSTTCQYDTSECIDCNGVLCLVPIILLAIIPFEAFLFLWLVLLGAQ